VGPSGEGKRSWWEHTFAYPNGKGGGGASRLILEGWGTAIVQKVEIRHKSIFNAPKGGRRGNVNEESAVKVEGNESVRFVMVLEMYSFH